MRHVSFERWLGLWQAGFDGLRRRIFPPPQHRESADLLLGRLRVVERLFWVALAGLALYLVADLGFVRAKRPPTLTEPRTPSGATEPAGSAGASAEGQLKPLAEYREALITRNPFGIAAQKIGAAIGGEQVKNRLTELASPLTVVGINRGRNPEALIEDTAAKRTSVVKVGDQINQLTVKSIDQTGVVVTYEGEEITLQ